MNFIGQSCPVCNKPFENECEVVVCPECGAPHHRQCYNETEKCFFTDKHGTFYWDNQNANSTNTTDTRSSTCVRCNFKNKPKTLFCENCGLPIMNVTPSSKETSSFNNSGNKIPNIFNQNAYAGNFDNTQTSKEKVYDDITASELADFVKANPDYYTQVAKRISVTGKSSFNYSAFFFSGFWLLFRKRYLAGFITIFSFLALWFTSLLLYTKYTVNTFVACCSYLGLSQNDYIPFDKMPMVQNFLQTLHPMDLFLTMLPYILDVILIASIITCGAIANRYYIKSCVQQIHKIKNTSKANKEEGKTLKDKLSGINMSLAVYSLFLTILTAILLRYVILN